MRQQRLSFGRWPEERLVAFDHRSAHPARFGLRRVHRVVASLSGGPYDTADEGDGCR